LQISRTVKIKVLIAACPARASHRQLALPRFRGRILPGGRWNIHPGWAPFIAIIPRSMRSRIIFASTPAPGALNFSRPKFRRVPDVSKCPYDLCFTQYLLGSARSPGPSTATFSFPVVGALLLKLPSIVRWGGAGRLLLQDEACALYNATAQPRAQGLKEIHGNILARVSLSLSLFLACVQFSRDFPSCDSLFSTLAD